MPDGQISIVSDHDNTNRLSLTKSSQYLTLQLQYTDQREGFERLIHNVQFLPTTTIHEVIKELLKRCNLEYRRPENVTLIEITGDKRYDVPEENSHLTLDDLNINNESTLRFQPSLISVASEYSSQLTIWGPNDFNTVNYEWQKSSTTLGILLEYVIQKFSLELIERERIHLFYRNEELDLASNYDKLLKELEISDGDFIDVKIIPSEPNQVSFANTTTTNGFLSSLNDQGNINRSSNTELYKPIALELRYTDTYENLTVTVSDQFSPTTEILILIRKLLESPDLKNVRTEDVVLVEFGRGTQRYPAPVGNKHKTVNQLEIEEGFTLYFESSLNVASNLELNLTIYGPNSHKCEYKWYKTRTTLGMLFEDIIKIFHLQPIERKRIRLTTLQDKQLDCVLDYYKLLINLGITDHESVRIEIVPSQFTSNSNENQMVHIECCHINGTNSFDAPVTFTIEELRKEIEKQFKDYLITDLKLFDRMHNLIDMSSLARTLSDFGIEPGQFVHARVELVFSRNPLSKLNTGNYTTIRSSSIIAKQQPDEVTVICTISSFSATIMIKVSANNTVAELLNKLETYKKNKPTAQFDMWCGSNHIDIEQPNRLLSDFGIIAGDTIYVKLIEKPVTKYKLESSHESTPLMLDYSSRSQQFNSTPSGLTNLGNTCYMNSALQCLAHAKPLTQFFLDGLAQNASEDEKGLDGCDWNQFYDVGSVTGAYADVLKNLYLPKRSMCFNYYRPEHIKETIGQQAPRFATNDQQDAQEFMTYLLDEIHKELKEKNGSESTTIIEELFFGKMQSTVTCQECQHQVKTTNIISFLPLPLGQQARIFIIRFIGKDGTNEILTVNVPEDGQVKSIVQAFAECHSSLSFIRTIIVMTDDGQLDLDMPLKQLSFSEVMLIEQDDYIGSLEFDRMIRCSKKLTLEGCLQDFCSLENLQDSWLCQQETCKKHTKATKQLEFCSLPPILIIQLKRFSHENGLRQKIETFIEYPKEALDLSRFMSLSSEEAIYDLFAVTCHTGSIYGGHYIAYAQHESNGKTEWYKFDDSYTTSCWFDSDIVSKDAYLLFYIKRDKSKQSTAVTTS